MTELGGRSAEEREAARRERELRRARVPDDGDGRTAPDEPDEAGGRAQYPEEQAHEPVVRRTSRAQRPPRRPARPANAERKHSWAGRVLAVLALLLTALVLWFLIALFQPFHGSGHGRVIVTIPRHASTSQIADILDRDGVISCAFPSCSVLFDLRAKLAGSNLLPGTYQLQRGMTFEAALNVLGTPPKAAPVRGVTIIPGETRAYLSARLHSEKVAGSYLNATRHSSLLNPRSFGAPAKTSSLEGFLFPDTYQLREPISIPALVADQLRDFKRHFSTVKLAYARSHHLSAYDVLIIASMIERESATAHDRPLIASVVYNRLRLGMRLQIDATTRYAVNNYTSPLTESQLHSPSPWNTYTHTGLPPTPIDSPSLASIQAAAHPATTKYLYFVVKPCGNGEQVFSSSYSQFLKDEQRYATARSQRGGRSPEHCSKS